VTGEAATVKDSETSSMKISPTMEVLLMDDNGSAVVKDEAASVAAFGSWGK
jgi:hypothetical protein